MLRKFIIKCGISSVFRQIPVETLKGMGMAFPNGSLGTRWVECYAPKREFGNEGVGIMGNALIHFLLLLVTLRYNTNNGEKDYPRRLVNPTLVPHFRL